MPPIIERTRCTDCRICYRLCPGDCFGLDEAKRVYVRYPDECWHCGACEIECPRDAIRIPLPFFISLDPRATPPRGWVFGQGASDRFQRPRHALPPTSPRSPQPSG
ncbi:MAG: ferredoxin family protein [Chloroflexi bacterium]|nr:ferredoxin family protein [Chloroflexota bacterium]